MLTFFVFARKLYRPLIDVLQGHRAIARFILLLQSFLFTLFDSISPILCIFEKRGTLDFLSA